MNITNEIVRIVAAIKEDKNLSKAFIKVLRVGSYSQQARVSQLKEHIEKQNPPEELSNFVNMLGNDKIAHWVLDSLLDEEGHEE